MNKGKVAFAALGVVLLYFVAVGGSTAVAENGTPWLELLTSPLTRGNPLDVVLAMVAVIALAFAALPSTPGFDRTTLLRGVALGSALIAALCAAAVIGLGSQLDALKTGVLVLAMVSQAFIGLLASALLVTRREDRRAAWAPLVLNGSLACGTVALFLLPTA